VKSNESQIAKMMDEKYPLSPLIKACTEAMDAKLKANELLATLLPLGARVVVQLAKQEDWTGTVVAYVADEYSVYVRPDDSAVLSQSPKSLVVQNGELAGSRYVSLACLNLEPKPVQQSLLHP
jgi:hypothetical protein